MAEYTHKGSISTDIFTGSWADERPTSYRQGIFRLAPNGGMPLLGITSKLPSQKVDDPTFSWWEEPFPTQIGTVAEIYTDSALSTAYGASATAAVGSYVYVKIDDRVSVGTGYTDYSNHNIFIPGQVVKIRNSDTLAVDIAGDVEGVAALNDGLNQYSVLTVHLLEAATAGQLYTNSGATNFTCAIIGNAQEEGSERPAATSMRPIKYYNTTQIWRNALDITRTAQQTHLRTGDAYQIARRQKLLEHGLEMEKSLLFGVYNSTFVGPNNKPKRHTMGLDQWITSNANASMSTVAAYSSTEDNWKNGTTAQSGYDWLMAQCREIFKYGGSTRFAFGGSGALTALNTMARANSMFEITPTTMAYGTNVSVLTTPFGQLRFIVHPLLSIDPYYNQTVYVVDFSDFRWRYLQDTIFKSKNTKTTESDSGYDGSREEWLTEGGLEMHFPQKAAKLTKLGGVG